MPQLDFAYWPGQIVWALIIFGVLYLFMRATLVPRIRKTLSDRTARIEADMAEARRLRDEAEAEAEAARAEMAEARNKAQRTAADAKSKSAAQAAERNAVLEAELQTKLSAAEDRIRIARDDAMGQVSGIATETAGVLTEKLSGRAASGDELDRVLAAEQA